MPVSGSRRSGNITWYMTTSYVNHFETRPHFRIGRAQIVRSGCRETARSGRYLYVSQLVARVAEKSADSARQSQFVRLYYR